MSKRVLMMILAFAVVYGSFGLMVWRFNRDQSLGLLAGVAWCYAIDMIQKYLGK